MERPRVIAELSAYLLVLLRAGLRAGEEGDAGVFVLESPADLEREGPSPAFFLLLQAVVPERRAARATAVFETADEAREGMRSEVRRPPLWVLCRYLAGARGRGREEDEEMLAAMLRALHDHPVLTAEHLPSLRSPGGPDRFPVEIVEEREGWRLAGLSRPRALAAFQVTVPIVSALTEPLQRVLERDLRIEEVP